VIGFDNREEIAVHLHPALSTVALPYYEMGELAVQYLLGGEGARWRGRRLMPCPLIILGSS